MKRLLVPVLCLMLVPLAAKAQFFDQKPAPDPNAVYFGNHNAHIKALLQLQQEIQNLQQLIRYTKMVSTLGEARIKLGFLNEMQEKPDKTLCKNVSENLPCARAYGDLYPDFQKKLSEMITAPALASANSEISGDIPDESDQIANGEKPFQPQEKAEKSFFWTEITCLQERCSAIITPDPGDSQARYRVLPGETLPDGKKVVRISAAGVTLEQSGKTINLDPAPKPG